MPRENSFSDSDGRSLTPDLEEENDIIGPSSPTGSPVRERTSAERPVFDYPAPDGLPRSIEASRTPTLILQPTPVNGAIYEEPGSIVQQLEQTQSAPSATPARMMTNASLSPSTAFARPGAAAARFRASARKIIHMKRGSSAITSSMGVGAEPGVDPRKAAAYLQYGHLRSKCNIEIIDYSSVRQSFGKFENKGFVEYLKDPKASKRESWVKVRWINIGGISWDVISQLALNHSIHPLALEDVLHGRTKSRSKSDYYEKHLFIRILRHTLLGENENGTHLETIAPAITNLPRSQSPSPLSEDYYSAETDDDKTLAGSKFNTKKRYDLEELESGEVERETHSRTRTSSTLRMRRAQVADAVTIEDLKKGERVNVSTLPFFIFLFRDGTVISLSPTTDLEFTAPIVARLRQRDTGLRATADPSLLLQSLLDLIVDNTLEVVDEYQRKILKMEHQVLIRPNMKTVRYLHILSGDLQMHKRTLEPIKTLVYGLRRYDVDRCAALINSSGMDPVKVQGFMSHKSKIYLADVHDHIDHVLNSLDMFAAISENLVNYTFNMASYEMNETMRRLTFVTIIFLPLTLLTGYFGMNFTKMWSVNNQSDLFFWEIAIPMMIVVIFLFMYSDIGRLVHLVKKRWAARKVTKAVKQKQL